MESICSHAKFGDKRLNLRLDKIINTLSGQMGCSIPQAIKEWGQTKAVYRFLSNQKVVSETILSAQLDSWFDKSLSAHSVILGIHDTTELDFTSHRSKEQLGCLMYENKKGFFLHNILLCSASGVPQVVFHQHYWGRDPLTLGRRKERKHLPIEQKESGRWLNGFKRVRDHFKNYPDTTLINICDREGDIYELLEFGNQSNSHYIIRSSNNRRVKESEDKLWDQVKKQEIRGHYSIELTDRSALKKRVATIAIRWLENIILAPTYRKGKEKLSTIKVNMVYVEEINAPKGVTPINWKLLTSLEISSLEQALKIVTYYRYRWHIETFHYVLKQGFKVEDLQLEQEHNLKNAISLYSLMACRLMAMMHLSREKPQSSLLASGFTVNQYVFMCNYLEKNYQIKIDPRTKENPTIENFTQMVGILGGYQKHNKRHPGIKVLWRGMKELMTILNCFALMPEKRYG